MKKIKLLLPVIAASSVIAPLVTTTTSCSKDKEDTTNGVECVGSQKLTTPDNSSTAEFKFKLKHKLNSGQKLWCTAKNITPSATPTEDGELTINGGTVTFSDDLYFTVSYTIYWTVGAIQKDQSVSFSLIFSGVDNDGAQWQTAIDDFTITKGNTTEKAIPNSAFDIQNGVLVGMKTSWATLTNYDTILIPNNVVEIHNAALQNVSGSYEAPGSNIKTLRFEEGSMPLYLGTSGLFQLYEMSKLVLPSRLAYVAHDNFRDCAKLTEIDVSSWTQEKFNQVNPFAGLTQSAFGGLGSNGHFVCQTGLELETYFIFTTLNSIFRNWFEEFEWKLKETEDKVFRYIEVEGYQEKFLQGINLDVFQGDTIVIPDQMTRIAPGAFDSVFTKDLTPNTSKLVIGENSQLTKIHSSAFAHCNSFKNVEIKAKKLTTIDFNTFTNCSQLEKVVLPSQLRELGDNCFYQCLALTDVNLKSTLVSKIPVGCFFACKKLNELPITTHTTWIGADAYTGCQVSGTVAIPSIIDYIGAGAFYGCSNLDFNFLNARLTYIGDQAFYGISPKFTKVILPNTLEYIGAGAFGNNPYLTSISVTAGGNYESEDNAIYEVSTHDLVCACSGTTSVKAETTKIKPYACAGIHWTNDLDISETNIKEVGEFAFTQVTSEKDNFTIIFPDAIEKLGNSAFAHSNVCDIVTLPTTGFPSIKEDGFGDSLFDGCKTIKDVTIPTNVTTVPFASFRSSGVTRLTLHNKIENIDSYAFQGCQFEWIDVSTYDAVPPASWLTVAAFQGAKGVVEGYTTHPVTIKVKAGTTEDVKTAWKNAFLKAGFDSKTKFEFE